jgi:nucleotide-binding universal stress UspA family protein
MPRDDRNLLDVLKFELEFLEQGGYGRLPREAWRPRFVFEDSPTCMNFNSKDREPCSECLLMQFVPEEARKEQTPCIHILLSLSGETLESLYRTGTQQEIETALGDWLRATIHRLETEKMRQAAPANSPR